MAVAIEETISGSGKKQKSARDYLQKIDEIVEFWGYVGALAEG
jgi:hypothetical protein